MPSILPLVRKTEHNKTQANMDGGETKRAYSPLYAWHRVPAEQLAADEATRNVCP